MPPSPAKKSPKKKKSPVKKLAVKADYGGIVFGKEEPPTSRAQEPEGEDYDPLASYRAAAKAAAAAAVKEKKDEAQLALFKKIFMAMDTDGDGKVAMADMVEKVATGTQQLSHRAQASRPDGAVALQLPMVFTLDEWTKEMRRMAGQMDQPTFEANVMGLFECFQYGDEPVETAAASGADGTSTVTVENQAPIDRKGLLLDLFNTMDDDGNGIIDVDDFLAQARTSEEANELRSLFHFFDSNFGAKDSQLTFEAFAEGTLTKTPVGQMRDATFASAVRGMTADVQRALAAKRSAKKKLGLLKDLFVMLDKDKNGVLDEAEFLAQAKSSAEAEELRSNFEQFDSVAGPADGKLTFRKFATGTMKTPLGRLQDEAFEKTVSTMISDMRSAIDEQAVSVN